MQPLSIMEVLFPVLSLGALTGALVVAGFLAGHLREVRVYVGLLVLLSVSLLAVVGDVAVLVFGGLQGRLAIALQFNRLQELANSAYLVAVPFMLTTILPRESPLRWAAHVVTIIGSALFAVIFVAALAIPESFLSVTENLSNGRGIAYSSARGRGEEGPLFVVRDVALAGEFVVVAAISIVGLARREITGAFRLTAIGTLIGLAAGASAVYANLTGGYPGPLDGLRFSRVSAGIMVFTVLAMGTYVIRFVNQSRTLDFANRELEHRRDRLAFLAYHNGATMMPNREALFRDLSDMIGTIAPAAGPQAGTVAECYLCRIDNLTAIEDSYGSRTAEQVLLRIGRRIAAVAEEIFDQSWEHDAAPPARPGDRFTVYHVEGASFVLVHRGEMPPTLRRSFEEALLRRLDEALDIDDEAVYLSASVASARVDPGVTDPDQGFRRLKRALAGGGGSADPISRYSDELHSGVGARMQLVQQLRAAVQRGDFSLVYQPIVAPSGAIVAAEALIRWKQASPATFIGLAEESGLIVPITRLVVETVCRDLTALRHAFPGIQVHLNVSPGHLGRIDLPGELMAGLTAVGETPDALSVEITETGFWGGGVEVAATLAALREAGIGVAIDDFGTGFSSLDYLKTIPASTVKIDKSFVDGLPTSREDRAIVEAVLILAHEFGRRVVAEGVESAAQRDYLVERGIDSLQGFLFARPLPIDRFLRLDGLTVDAPV